MSLFLPPNKLFIEILNINYNNSAEYQSLPQVILKLCPPDRFPIEGCDVSQLVKKLGVCIDPLSVINCNNYSLLFSFEVTSTIYSFFSSCPQTTIKYMTILILNYYIAWMISSSNGESIEHLPVLLELINKLLMLPISHLPENAKLLLSSSFFNVVSYYLAKFPSVDFPSFMPSVTNFLENNSDLPTIAFDLLSKAAVIILKSSIGFDNKVQHFFQQVCSIISHCQNRFPMNIIDNISIIIHDKVKECDNIALQIASKIIASAGPSPFIKVAKEIPQFLVSKVISEPPINPFHLVLGSVSPICAPNATLPPFGFPYPTTYSNSDIMCKSPFFPVKPLKDMISSSLLTMIENVYEFITSSIPIYESFITSLTSIVVSIDFSIHIIDLFSLIVYIFSLFPKVENDGNIIKVLMKSAIFDPRLTYIEDNFDYQCVSTIRQSIIKILSSGAAVTFFRCLSEYRKFPILYSEIVYRILDKELGFPNNMIGFMGCKKALCEEISYFYSFYKCSNEIQIVINHSRNALLKMLNQIFCNVSVYIALFSDQGFCREIITLFTEKPLRTHLREIILSYMVSDEGTRNSFMLKDIKTIIKLMIESNTDEESSGLLLDTLYLIVLLIEKAPIYILSFVELSERLCNKVQTIQSKEIISKYISSLIDFLFRIYRFHSVLQNELLILEQSIINVYGNYPPYELLEKLLCLLSGEFNVSDKVPFIIKQPKVFVTIFHVFQKSDYFPKVISITNALCSYSISNCEQVHKIGLDIIIIHIIEKSNYEHCYDPTIIKALLDLLKCISSKVCSVSMVYQFISLLNVNFGGNKNIVAKQALSFVEESILDSLKKPLGCFPLYTDKPPLITGFTEQLFLRGFTCGVWIFLFNNSDVVDIVTITDNERLSLYCIIENGSIKYYLEMNGTQWEGSSYCDIQPNKWTYITFTVSIESSPRNTIIITNLGGESYRRLTFPFIEIKKSSFIVSIGEHKNGKKKQVDPGMYGPISFFDKLTNQEIDSLIEICPRIIPFNPQPFLIVTPKNSNNDILLQLHANSTNYGISFTQPMHQIAQSFTDIIFRKTGLSVFLPLFSQIDSMSSIESPSDNFLHNVIMIFRAGFFASYSLQEEFCKSNSFSMISYLLIHANPEIITYSLYMSFIGMIDSIQNELCIYQLLSSILFNFELWIKSPSQDHKKILHHWVFSLLPAYQDIFFELLPFSVVLSALRVYYWYNPIETGIIRGSTIRASDFPTSECRKDLFLILYHYSNSILLPTDIDSLIGQILTLAEIEQVMELLSLLHFIIKTPTKPSGIKDINQILNLYQMFSISDDRISEILYSIFIDALKYHCIPELTIDFLCHVFITNPPSPSKDLFENLLMRCSNESPYLLSVCCIVAANTDLSLVNRIFNTLEASEIYTRLKFWALWPVSSLILSDESTQFVGAGFLAACGPKGWRDVAFSIEASGQALGIDFYCLYDFFLKAISSFIQCNDNSILESAYYEFFYIVSKFLILKHHGHMTSPLKKSIKNSVFYVISRSTPDSILNPIQNEESFEDSPRNPIQSLQSKSKKRHRSSFCSIDFVPLSRNTINKPHSHRLRHSLFQHVYSGIKSANPCHFGLRLDDGGKWEDYELSCDYLQVYSKRPDLRYLPSILVLSGIHKRIGNPLPSEILNIIKSLTSDLNPYFSVFASFSFSGGETNYISNIQQLINQSNEMLNTIPQLYSDDMFNYIKQYLEFSRQSQSFISYLSTTYGIDLFKASNFICSHVDAISSTIGDSRKKWLKFWLSITINKAPWCKSVLEKRVNHKRDTSYSIWFYPSKIRKTSTFQNYDSTHSIKRNEPSSIYSNDEHEDSNEILSQGEDAFLKLCQCDVVTPISTTKAFFSLSQDSIILERANLPKKVIKLKKISHLLLRHWNGRPSIELICMNGYTVFIAFLRALTVDVLTAIRSVAIPNLKHPIQTSSHAHFFSSLPYLNKWVQRQISNFDYILLLNMFSGRSFNTTSQYPIFPWILSDFNSSFLDFSNTNHFRDLSKPIGIFKDELKSIISEWFKKSGYHYDKAPMTQSTVQILLSNFIHHSHDSFKAPKFNSIRDMFNHCVSVFSEALPEFYFFPEFLYKDRKNDESCVILPPWATTPFDFIYKQRKALESEYVSSHLHEWINLIWGINITGEWAQKHFNVYSSSLLQTSPNYDIDNGSLPNQLFSSAHPQKNKYNREYIPSFEYSHNFKNVAYATIRSRSSQTINITYMSSHGSFSLMQTTIQKESETTTSTERNEISAKTIIDFPLIRTELHRFVWDAGKFGFIVFDKMKQAILLVDPLTGSSYKTLRHNSRIRSVTSSTKWLAFSDNDSNLIVYSDFSLSAPDFVLRIFAEPAKSMAVSSEFYSVALATKDHSLIIVSLTSKTISHFIELGEITVSKILFTKCWGFIVTYDKKYVDGLLKNGLSVYSINGVLLKRIELNNPIMQMFTFSSKDGFDYVVFSNSNNEILLFEAYYPERIRHIAKLSDPSVSFYYWDDIESLIVISKTKVVSVPITF